MSALPYHDHIPLNAAPPEVDQVTLTRVQFRRGAGCCSESPVRIVTAYYHPDGQLLVEFDPHTPEGPKA